MPSRPPSVPPSGVRIKRRPLEAWSLLSLDAVAAVLDHARAVLAEERRLRPHLAPLRLPEFAGRVRAAASDAAEDGSGNHMLVAPLFAFLRARGETKGLTLRAFKARLVEAHGAGLLWLSHYENSITDDSLPVAASAIHCAGQTLHMVGRDPGRGLRGALDLVVSALSREGYAEVWAHAQRVRADEKRREGRPRLCTLFPEAFAARVQAVVNEIGRDMLIATLLRAFEDRGEATGLSAEGFKARLVAAHAARVLSLRSWVEADGGAPESIEASAVLHEGSVLHLVRRTAEQTPVPWGRPALPLRPAKAAGSDGA